MQKTSYLLFIGVMFALLGCGTAVATKEPSDPASSMKVTAQYPLSAKNMPNMPMDEFEQIKNGMTYEQVTQIVGATGEIFAETGTPGNQFFTVTYQFKGEKECLDMFKSANVQLIFQGGKLTTKTQMGLKKSKYEEMGKLK
ncbi:MAG TPA: hypothetical protein VFC58_07400 [Desulfosporosinus sp.]|nr:hypothetical protein [Desulfosporosinus sp.]